MNVHQFESTVEAYDACQYRDRQYCEINGLPEEDVVRNGDILVIASEAVIGIADTWPIAILYPGCNSESHSEDDGGALHTLMRPVNDDPEHPLNQYRRSVEKALEVGAADADITGNACWTMRPWFL